MTLASKIIELRGPDYLRRSVLSIRDGGGVFEKLLAGKGYKTILEIGTYRGVSAAEMSQYCEKVITIDLKRGRMENLGETPDREGLWRDLGISNIELHLVKNDREKAALVNGLEFDFAFVDGAHDQTVRDDFELVKRCGKVLFHDVDSRGKPELDYVYDFVMSLPKEQIEIHDIFALWTRG
jgi:predicted O-methyltransferase YrrM